MHTSHHRTLPQGTEDHNTINEDHPKIVEDFFANVFGACRRTLQPAYVSKDLYSLFSSILLKRNHIIILVQFGINKHWGAN